MASEDEVRDLSDEARELYGVPPERFVAERDARVRDARQAGNRPLATALARLRRPAASAWAVNLLVRDQPEELNQLVSLGEELRQAQARLHGAALRDLASSRQRVVSGFVHQARRLAFEAGRPLSDGAVVEVEQTLLAAVADPELARRVLSGQLVKPLSHTGFGPAPVPAPEPASEPAAQSRPSPGRPGRQSGRVPAERDKEARRQREEGRRRAQELAGLEAERRSAQDDLDVAEAELTGAERLHTQTEQARDATAALVESLRAQLTGAERELRELTQRTSAAARQLASATRVRDSGRRRLEAVAARLRQRGIP